MDSDNIVAPRRKKDRLPAPLPPPPEISGDERNALTDAYKAGLILAWKRDAERGYCLSLAGRQDEYVTPKQLTVYLGKLKGAI